MRYLQKPIYSLLAFAIFFLIFSCDKEDAPNQDETTQLVPVQIVTGDDATGTGDLTITSGNGVRSTQSDIPYNAVQEVAVHLDSEGTFIFEMEDQAFGQFKIFASQEELRTYTPANPLLLEFEHYKNQIMATFSVQSEADGLNRRRFIDLTVRQEYGSLYHIDWGDGSEEVAEAPMEVLNAGDRIEHRYSAPGEYTITLSTTNTSEVSGLDLQITGNGKGDKIQTLDLPELPNLTYLSLGDNTFVNVDPILERFPNLNLLGLRFGNLASIDVSKNPSLSIVVIGNDFDTQIKGLSTLTQLKFLGVTGDIENLDLSQHPQLFHVNIRGHKMNTLDVSQNPLLTTLILQSNNLQQIDLSSNVNLESLYITNNNLSQLDLSNNPEITHLNLYANFIEELDITQQMKLEFLNLSSVHLRQVASPLSLDYITYIDLTNSRFLNEADLLDAVFLGQENNPKTNGQIIFNDLAVVLDRQIPLLYELVNDYDWTINVPD